MQRFISRIFTNSDGLDLIDIGELISLYLAFRYIDQHYLSDFLIWSCDDLPFYYIYYEAN